MGSTAVAVGAALVALAFCFSTLERWMARRRRHELAWAGALALFVVAAVALAAGAGLGWDGANFRTFYLFGAILNVPFLALGTLYLLWGPRLGDRAALVLGLAGAFAVGVVVTAPFRAPIPSNTLVQGSHVFGVLPRVLAGVASGGGAAVIVGGALWSIVRQRRARAVLSNGLIAVGTLVLGASGLLNSVFDAMSAFAVALLVGITIIFVGFLVATAGAPVPVPASASGPLRSLGPGTPLTEGSDGAASPPSHAEAHPRT
jgi:hypothetical protein